MINNRDIIGYKEVEALVHTYQKKIESLFDEVIYGYKEGWFPDGSCSGSFTTYAVQFERENLKNLQTLKVIEDTLASLLREFRDVPGTILHIRRPLAIFIEYYVAPKIFESPCWIKQEAHLMDKVPQSSGIIKFTISGRMGMGSL